MCTVTTFAAFYTIFTFTTQCTIGTMLTSFKMFRLNTIIA